MEKTFKLVESELSAPSMSSGHLTVTNWKLCVICQEEKGEPLTCPSKSRRKDVGSGYRSLAENLKEFYDLGQLPIQLERLDEGQGIEMTMVANKALYHHSCRLKYNNTMLRRAEKRALKRDREDLEVIATCKRSRSRSVESVILSDLCFFCGQPPGDSVLHEAATFQIDERVRTCAKLLQDTELIAKLSAGDMVALEAKYHTKCLVGLYNRARKAKSKRLNGVCEEEVASRIAFAELVMYIEEIRNSDEQQAPVFKLSDLAQLYVSRMEQLGVKLDARVHTTRLKQRLLAQFMDMQAQKQGRDILMAFKDDIGTALAKSCEFDSDSDVITLHMQHRLYAVTCLGKLNLLMDFQQDVRKNLCRPSCFP